MSKWFSISQNRYGWHILDNESMQIVKTLQDYDDAVQTAARYRAYFKARSEGTTALHAWQQVKHDERAPKLDWDRDANGNPEATWSLDGYVCVATIKDDEYGGDWDDARGTFTNDWQPGAIRNRSIEYGPSLNYRHWRTCSDQEYYIPGEGSGNLDELRSYFSRAGASRHVADCAARKMMQEVMDDDASAYENNYYCGVVVTVTSLDGQQAEDSLWGIECDPYQSNNEAYWSECAMDCARNAIYELDKIPVG